MLVAWVKENKKVASKIMGVNFLVMALVLLFWSQPKEGMSEDEKAAANVARMEAQASDNSQKKVSQSPSFMKDYKQTQKTQLRVFLIFMVISGTGFLVYGFLKKEDIFLLAVIIRLSMCFLYVFFTNRAISY